MSSDPNLDDLYYQALGRFVHMYARAEDSLNLQNYLFATDALKGAANASIIARALTGPQRFNGARDTLKRLLRVTQASQSVIDDVKSVLDHFGEIHFVRDRLVHYGAYRNSEDDNTRLSTAHGKELGTIKPLIFTPEILLNLARDCEIMPMRVSMALNPSVIESTRISIPDYVDDVLGPWHFKPQSVKLEIP